MGSVGTSKQEIKGFIQTIDNCLEKGVTNNAALNHARELLTSIQDNWDKLETDDKAARTIDDAVTFATKEIRSGFAELLETYKARALSGVLDPEGPDVLSDPPDPDLPRSEPPKSEEYPL